MMGRGLFMLLSSLLFLAAPLMAQAGEAALRDPALPYGSWGEAARETEAAIGGRALVQPASGHFAVGDAVILNDDGKRYRAHVKAIEDGRYVVHYDGFSEDWTVRVGREDLLGYQPGYRPVEVASGGGAAPAEPRLGEELEAESKGKWYEARVVAIRPGSYRVHFDGQPSSADEWVSRARLRFLPGERVVTAPLALGKYACTASRYDSGSGRYRFDPRGSVVLQAGGGYQYLGFAQPSSGQYRADAASRVLTFTGGFLAGGEATPIVRRPGRFYLTAPGIGERWTCGRAE